MAAGGADKPEVSRAGLIERNPSALPHAYVVPKATVSRESDAVILARFREDDPRQGVFMHTDPLRQVSSGTATALHRRAMGIARSRSSGPRSHDAGARLAGRDRHVDAGLDRPGQR